MGGLTALQVRNAKPGRHADGRGLYLVVRDTGSRAWVVRVQVDGKRRDLGLGSTDAVSLADARIAAANLRRQAKSGEKPIGRIGTAAASTTSPTFEKAARLCHEAMKKGWRNRRHVDSWLACLENYVFPAFGAKRVDEIDSIMVRDVLEPIWLKIPETARRILQRVGAVLDYAHVKGWCPTEAALRSVRKGLPRQPARDSHFEAMPFEDVPAFVAALKALPLTAGRDALRFTIYTAVRSNEARNAVWPEFDLDKAVWSIPGDRMKTGKPHIVPLSASAVKLLRARWALRSSDEGLVFSFNGKRPISDMTMTKVLRSMKLDRITVHGFRSAFTDWTAEETAFPKEIADKALAHQLPDRVEAAYRRTDFFEKRRKLMHAWCAFVDGESEVDAS